MGPLARALVVLLGGTGLCLGFTFTTYQRGSDGLSKSWGRLYEPSGKFMLLGETMEDFEEPEKAEEEMEAPPQAISDSAESEGDATLPLRCDAPL